MDASAAHRDAQRLEYGLARMEFDDATTHLRQCLRNVRQAHNRVCAASSGLHKRQRVQLDLSLHVAKIKKELIRSKRTFRDLSKRDRTLRRFVTSSLAELAAAEKKCTDENNELSEKLKSDIGVHEDSCRRLLSGLWKDGTAELAMLKSKLSQNKVCKDLVERELARRPDSDVELALLTDAITENESKIDKCEKKHAELCKEFGIRYGDTTGLPRVRDEECPYDTFPLLWNAASVDINGQWQALHPHLRASIVRIIEEKIRGERDNKSSIADDVDLALSSSLSTVSSEWILTKD
jgi:hypothetical protein